MSDRCEVVKVVTDNEDGFKEINKSDYNDKDFKLFVDKPVKASKTKSDKAE